ncbi:MAG TPA: amino acid ABC transporter permease [Actinomycetota bacterium]|nr:amino acid ABC transporter permease [Actinomycetota bacterium]
MSAPAPRTAPGQAADPGPFGVDEHVSALARAGLIVAVAAVALALVRPLGGDASVWNRVATGAGIGAVLLGIAGRYVAGARGIRGASIGQAAIAAGALAALYAYFDGAVRDGTFDPGRFWQQYFDPDVLRTLPGDFARGMVNTLKLAFLAEVLAIGVGLLVATFVLSQKFYVRYPAVGYVDLVRGLPLVVLTFLIHFGLPNIGVTFSPFISAVVILTVNASAYVAEIFRAGIQALPRGQMEAARSLGMPHAIAMTSVIVPQAARAVIPPLLSEFIALIKDTAIVIALIGFTTASRDLFGAARTAAASTFSPTPYMAAGIVYLMMTVPLSRLVGVLERRLRTKTA